MYGHRPTMTPRYLELLEMLKNEYEGMYQEISMNKMHREDNELKIDVVALQKALYELERSHVKMKQQYDHAVSDLPNLGSYEDEIARLKHELEERGGPSFVPGTSAAALVHFPTIPNLEQELQGFASGFANLPTTHHMENIHGPIGGGYGGGYFTKRGPEDEGPTWNRNVRARDDSTTRRSSISQQIQSIPATRPMEKKEASSTVQSPTNAPSQNGNGSSGFDWLVVYNPKASRTLTIDLLHTMMHDNVVCCVRFSTDGKYLATGSNRIASVYDVKTGERIGSFVDLEGIDKDTDQFVRSVAFSPDGKSLVTGSEDQIVRVWDITSQRLKCRLSGHSQDIYSIDFMPNGKEVVSGSGDRTVRIWDIEGARCRLVLNVQGNEAGKDAGITSVAISPNGKYVAAGSLDRTIRLWETESGKSSETLEGHRDSVYSVAFAPDGRHLITGSLDKTIKVWQFDNADNIHRGTCKYTILGHKDFVLSVAGTPPDGRWIISGSKDRSVQFWDSQNGTTQLMLQGHKNSVISVAVSASGMIFATGSGDCRARIWSYSYVMADEQSSIPSVSRPSSNLSSSSGSLKSSKGKVDSAKPSP